MFVDGYVRVSQVAGRSGESFISPSLQREQIEEWAKLNGAVIGEVFEELDESGARADRPLLGAALKRVERGDSQGIVVAKLDRFGRSLIDGLGNIERITAAGGTFVSVQDGLDVGTPTGKLVLRIMLSMAEWELDRIRAMWKTAKARAVQRGVYVGSRPPFGYIRGEDGRLRPHPQTAALMRQVYERRARGARLAEIARWLEAEGALTAYGNKGWTVGSLSQMIANRTYLGEVRAAEIVKAGAHMPLVDPATWQAAQEPHELPPRRTRLPTLLGGLVRCAGCRMAMSSTVQERASGQRLATYKCRGHTSAGACPAAAHVSGSLIEPYVEQAFFAALEEHSKRTQRPGKRLVTLREKAAKAEGELTQYRDSPRVLSALGAERFAAGLEKRRRTLEGAFRAVAAEERRTRGAELPDPGKLDAQWPEMTIPQRRAAIGELIDCVFVEKGCRDIAKRAFVCFRGEAPADLMRPGQRVYEQRPFDATEVRAHREPRALPGWSKARVTEEARAFLAGRSHWPRPEEFINAGRARLYEELLRHGSADGWAAHFGLAMSPRNHLVNRWDERRIRAALDVFLRGKRHWPTREEFRAAGYRGVRDALRRYGGAKCWARQYGLPEPHTGTPDDLYWTEERIEATLRGLIADGDYYPRCEDFRLARLEGLYVRIGKREGHVHWIKRLGVQPPPHSKAAVAMRKES